MGRRLMAAASDGKLPAAQSVNFEHVYHELRAIARRFFEGEREGHTLTPTSLVHEAWMRIEKTSELSEADGQRQVRAIMATAVLKEMKARLAWRESPRRMPVDDLVPDGRGTHSLEHIRE